jgi:hypothetical protein
MDHPTREDILHKVKQDKSKSSSGMRKIKSLTRDLNLLNTPPSSGLPRTTSLTNLPSSEMQQRNDSGDATRELNNNEMSMSVQTTPGFIPVRAPNNAQMDELADLISTLSKLGLLTNTKQDTQEITTVADAGQTSASDSKKTVIHSFVNTTAAEVASTSLVFGESKEGFTPS